MSGFSGAARAFAARAGRLSGGQQKQVEFAKARLQQPRLCLVDEPSIGLAPALADEVFAWIEKFARAGMGILLIDHNVRRVVRMSDRIHVLSLGRITAAGGRDVPGRPARAGAGAARVALLRRAAPAAL